MASASILQQLRDRLHEGAAIGINNTLQLVLADLKQHVPVRTGRLQAGFVVTQLATRDNLQGAIGNPVFYAPHFYPFRSPPVALQEGPTLFKPPPGNVPVTDGKQIDQTAIGELLRTEVEAALQQTLGK